MRRPLWFCAALLLVQPATAAPKETVPTVTFVTPQLGGPQASPTLYQPNTMIAASVPQLYAGIAGGSWQAAPIKQAVLPANQIVAAQTGLALPNTTVAAALKAAASSNKEKPVTIMAGLSEYGATAAQTAAQKDTGAAKTGSETGFFKAAKLGSNVEGTAALATGVSGELRGFKRSGLSRFSPQLQPISVAALSTVDAAKPYDNRQTPVHPDDKVTLLISGYRFDDATGRILVPEGGELTYGDMARMTLDSKLHRRRAALERIWHLVLHEDAGGRLSQARIEAIVNQQRDVLPGVALKPWLERRMSDFKKAVESRFISLARLDDHRETKEDLIQQAKGDAEAASLRGKYFDEGEAKLGAVLQKNLAAHLSKNPEGAKLLAEIKALGGTLPILQVLKIDDRYRAFYTSYSRSVVLNFDYLIQRIPGAAGINTPAALSELLVKNPSLLDAFLADEDVTLFHELVHYKQDLANAFQPITRYLTLDIEYEAFFRQNTYFHSKLAANPSAVSHHMFGSYLGLVNNFDAWIKEMDELYYNSFPSTYADLETGSAIQKERSRLAALFNAEGGSDEKKHALKRLTLIKGHRAIRLARERADAMLAEFREKSWTLRTEGYPNIARAFAAQGHHGAAADFMTYAAQDNPALKAESMEIAAKAAAWLALPSNSAPLADRLRGMAAVERAFSGKSWPLTVFQAGLTVYSDAVEAGPDSTAFGIEPAKAAQFLQTYKDTARSYAGQLVEFAVNSSHPADRNTNLDSAITHAELSGSAELVAALRQARNLGLNGPLLKRIRALAR